MKLKVYLGVDLGAESGRVMAGLWDGQTVRLEEVHRFPNGGVYFADTFRWDVLRLWSEIQTGLTIAAKKYGDAIVSVGVDTWGVDFVLLTDDCSTDATVRLATSLGVKTFAHMQNLGYGANQKTCYREALKYGSDIRTTSTNLV